MAHARLTLIVNGDDGEETLETNIVDSGQLGSVLNAIQGTLLKEPGRIVGIELVAEEDGARDKVDQFNRYLRVLGFGEERPEAG